MNYLITGSTGFVGGALINKIAKSENKIIVLSRSKIKALKKFKNVNVEVVESLDKISVDKKIDIIINLAGEPIANKKWSKKQKEILLKSRIDVTKNIINLIAKLEQKPQMLISASAIGYYGSQGSSKLDENSVPHQEFTNFLCKNWEDEALKATNFKVRTCIFRFGIILGKNGGALKKMLPPFKLALGGKIASGKQFMSWVHIDDVISAINFAIDKKLKGKFNLTAPRAVTNLEFTKTLAKKLNRPAFFDMPEFMVKILFGEMGLTLLAKGQNVYPQALLEEGFRFKYNRLEEALEDVFS